MPLRCRRHGSANAVDGSWRSTRDLPEGLDEALKESALVQLSIVDADKIEYTVIARLFQEGQGSFFKSVADR